MLVIPLSEEPGTDMYWHQWLVVEFSDFTFDFEYQRAVLEPIIKTVPFEEYDYENDEELDMADYANALGLAFDKAGLTATTSLAHMAFPAGE